LEAIIRRYPDQWNWLGFKRADAKLRKSDSESADVEELEA
jgi:hypothetical protein